MSYVEVYSKEGNYLGAVDDINQSVEMTEEWEEKLGEAAKAAKGGKKKPKPKPKPTQKPWSYEQRKLMSDIVETTETVELAEVTEQEQPVVLTVVEGGDSEEVTEEPAQPEMDFNVGAMRIAQAIRGVFQSGQEPVALLVNPDLKEQLEAAFRALPDDMIPAQLRDHLPIVADPTVNPCRIITSYDVMMQRLMQRYGPRKDGGNGLLEAMAQAIQLEGTGARITDDFLITYYLLEIAEQVKPRVVVPGASEVLRNLQLAR
jgi:hypothetical protein